MSYRSEAPANYETDYETGHAIFPGDSASQPGIRSYPPCTDDDLPPAPSQPPRRKAPPPRAPPRVQPQGDDDDLISQLAERSVLAESMEPEQLGMMKRLGCDRVMNFNCVLTDVKVRIDNFRRTEPGTSRQPPASVRLEHCVRPSSNLVRLREKVEGVQSSYTIARGHTNWAAFESTPNEKGGFEDVASFPNQSREWNRGVYIPNSVQKPKQDHLNRRYIDVHVWERDHSGERKWENADASARVELVYKASTSTMRRKAHLKIVGPDQSVYEFDIFVTMRASTAKAPTSAQPPPPPVPQAARLAVRRARGAVEQGDVPPSVPVAAPTVSTQDFARPRRQSGNQMRDPAGDTVGPPKKPPIDACKVLRNIAIGVTAGAVGGCITGVIYGLVHGGAAAGGAHAAAAASGAHAAAPVVAAPAAAAAAPVVAAKVASAAPAAKVAAASAHGGSAVSGGATAAGGAKGGAGGAKAAAPAPAPAAEPGSSGASHASAGMREPAGGHFGEAEEVGVGEATGHGTWIGATFGMLGAGLVMLLSPQDGGFCDPRAAATADAEAERRGGKWDRDDRDRDEYEDDYNG